MYYATNHHALQNISVMIAAAGGLLIWAGRMVGRRFQLTGYLIFGTGGLAVFVGLVGILASVTWPKSGL